MATRKVKENLIKWLQKMNKDRKPFFLHISELGQLVRDGQQINVFVLFVTGSSFWCELLHAVCLN